MPYLGACGQTFCDRSPLRRWNMEVIGCQSVDLSHKLIGTFSPGRVRREGPMCVRVRGVHHQRSTVRGARRFRSRRAAPGAIGQTSETGNRIAWG
eukprot:1880562-Prymnesium_polylepis.1